MSSVLVVPEQNQAMLKARLKKRPKATVIVVSKKGNFGNGACKVARGASIQCIELDSCSAE